jgi:hypothetical protein
MEEPLMAEEKKGNWFKRHKVLTVIGVLIVLVIIGSASSSSKDTGSKTSSNSAAASKTPAKTTSKPEAKLAKIGEAANDGKFSFTVNSFKCGETSVGDQYLSKNAQGQYCRLNISVKNIGNEAQTLDTDSQYLYNASGQKYSSDSTATVYAAPSSNSPWYASVNPGNTITGDILFDVPKDSVPITAELHDSALSGGVKVSLQ